MYGPFGSPLDPFDLISDPFDSYDLFDLCSFELFESLEVRDPFGSSEDPHSESSEIDLRTLVVQRSVFALLAVILLVSTLCLT
jgi:hypothetical protein